MDAMPQEGGGELVMMFHFLAAARWIHFTAVFVLFGSSLFWFYMGCDRSSDGFVGCPKTFRATVLLLRIATLAAAVSGAVWLIGIIANMTGGFSNAADPETLRLFFFETGFGPVSILRLALLGAAVVIAFLPWNNRAWLGAILSISTLLLMSQAWLGHAAEGGAGVYGAVMICVYSVHVLAAGAWAGGLPPLLFALAEQRHAHQARQWTLEILSRYSLMGMIAVTLIVISGAANAGFRVAGSFGKLFETNYGDVLATKIGIVAVMLTLAFFNRFVWMPELRAAAVNGLLQIHRLRRSVAFELALGVLVLGVAAILGITPPPR